MADDIGVSVVKPVTAAGDAGVAAGPAVDPAKARGFLQQLEGLLQNLLTLKVVTLVGDLSVAGDASSPTVSVKDPSAVSAASTEINLVDGHIVNAFSPDFSALSGGTMQVFHQAQVEKSSAIMLGNWAELQKLAASFLPARR